MRPSAQSATSNDPSLWPISSASLRSAVTYGIPRSAASAVTRSTIASEMSVATTLPRGPVDSAARNVTRPVPQATSITRSPSRMAASASMRSCAGSSCRAQY